MLNALENRKEGWYHSIEIQPGVITPGMGHQNLGPARLAMAGVDFTDCRCLDIACWDGLLSVLMARRGAVEVVAWDRERRINCERWPTIAHVYGPWRNAVEGHWTPFDVVTCTGLLYHTLDPLAWLLRARAQVRDGGLLILETAAYRSVRSKTLVWNGGRYYPEPSHGNYWFPTLGLLREWLTFARLKPITLSWFPQGKLCRVALCCRAVEKIDTGDPWQDYHQTCPTWGGAGLTVAEFVDWSRTKSDKHPVDVRGEKPVDFAQLGEPVDEETRARLAVLKMEDLI